jgi:hypothetical protein
MKIPLKSQTQHHTIIIIILAFAFIIFMGIILRLFQIDHFLDLPTRQYEYQIAYGDNGSASCNAYCQGIYGTPWNWELPYSWNGARCLDTINGGDCNTIKGSPTKCICGSTGSGWNRNGWRRW